MALNGPADDAEFAAAAERVAAPGAPVHRAAFDATDIAGHDARLGKIEAALGPLTVLISNAGVGVLKRSDLLEASEESWGRCMAMNAKAPSFLSQAFAAGPGAGARGGEIPGDRQRHLVERGGDGGAAEIAVYAVQPGLIATEMTAPVIEGYRKRAREGLTLFPRVGAPAEVGAIVAALATGRLPYSTGQTISADAGMLVPRF